MLGYVDTIQSSSERQNTTASSPAKLIYFQYLGNRVLQGPAHGLGQAPASIQAGG